MGQGEGRQPPDAEALVLPGQHVVGQVDFLVDHGELDLWVLTGNHLTGSDRERANKKTQLLPSIKTAGDHKISTRLLFTTVNTTKLLQRH